VAGCFAVYSTLFATGYWIYGDILSAVILAAVALAASIFLIVTWNRVNAA